MLWLFLRFSIRTRSQYRHTLVFPLKPTTNYMFGPVIDSPPSHPVIVLATLSYFGKRRGRCQVVWRVYRSPGKIKCGVAISDKTLYDTSSLSRRLITVGQHQQVELQTPCDYELCVVPASMIDDYGYLMTWTKSTLVCKSNQIKFYFVTTRIHIH